MKTGYFLQKLKVPGLLRPVHSILESTGGSSPSTFKNWFLKVATSATEFSSKKAVLYETQQIDTLLRLAKLKISDFSNLVLSGGCGDSSISFVRRSKCYATTFCEDVR